MLVETPLSGVRDIVLLLRSLPHMEQIDPEDITLLAEHGVPRTFAAGAQLEMCQPSGRVVHLLMGGRIEITRGTHREIVNGTGGVGFAELFADVCPPKAVALVQSTTLELPADFLFRAMEDNFSFVRSAIGANARFLLNLVGGLPQLGPTPEASLAPPAKIGGDSLVDRMSLLAGSVLDQASLDATIALARSMQKVSIERGETLFTQGDASRWWINIVSGRIRCENEAGSVEVADGYVLGVLDTIGELRRSYTARALVDVDAYRVDIEDWLSVIQTHPDLALGLLRMTSRNLLDATAALEAASPIDEVAE